MKLNHLESTTQSHAGDARSRNVQLAAGQVRRVEASEAVAPDRKRSLQQEMAEIDPRSVGPFEGAERVQDEARALAAQLTEMGEGAAKSLIKPDAQSWPLHQVDDAA